VVPLTSDQRHFAGKARAKIAGFAGNISKHRRNHIMATKPKKKNPRLASGRKRVRQDVKLNAANTSLRSKYRTVVKNVEKAVLAGDKEKATELFAKMQKVVDTVADKGIFHKNKAARDKSRLSTKVKNLVTAPATTAA
jgi:small subunit ribosomal protein S20